MTISITCDQCGRRYSVGDSLGGKRVKCTHCAAILTVPPANEPAPLDSLGSTDLSNPSGPLHPDRPPLTAARPPAAAVSGGPTDRQIRIGAAILVPLVPPIIVLAVVTRQTSVAGLLLIVLGPFAVLLGLAGLVDPNIVRAAGKYGKHLPRRYTLIALLIGVVAAACSVSLAFLALSS